MKKGKILLIAVGVLVLAATLFFKYIYYWAPDLAEKNVGGFETKCNDLNGKRFTYENISSVDGYSDGNGKIKFSRSDFEYVLNNQKTAIAPGLIWIYKDSWFKGPSLKYSWVCIVNFDKDHPENSTMSSKAKFYNTD